MTDQDPMAWLDRAEWVVHRDGPVATIRFAETDKPIEQHIEHHVGLAMSLEQLRWDDSVRVIVYAGRDDGSGLHDVGPRQRPPASGERPNSAGSSASRQAGASGYASMMETIGGPQAVRGPWSLSQGVERAFQTLALLEKPIIAKWTGDAGGFAGNALFGCDIIVAREDVTYTDAHLGRGAFSISAGDGALAFLPLFLTPTKLKELLLLGDTWTARQLAELGVVNYALPADQVDAKVEHFVRAFLDRPPVALARTKRVIHKRLVEQVNSALDAGLSAELLDIWQRPARLAADVSSSLQPDSPSWSRQWGRG